MNPSASALLTRTNSMAEWTPALAADRPVIAFWGGLKVPDPLPGHWEPYLMDLAEPCTTQLRTRIDRVDQNWVVGVLPEDSFHVSVSDKGRRAAYATLVASDTNHGYWDVWLLDRDASSVLRRVAANIQVPRVSNPGGHPTFSASGAVSPLPSLSGDGEVLAWLEYNSNFNRGDTNLMRLELDVPGAIPLPWELGDPNLGPYIGQLATTGSAISDEVDCDLDGVVDFRMAAGRTVGAGQLPGIALHDTIWLLKTAVPPPPPMPPEPPNGCTGLLPAVVTVATYEPLPSDVVDPDDTNDVTMSANGKVIAWASRRDFCTGTLNQQQDVWVWLENGGAAPAGIMACEDADSESPNGRIYRVTTGGVSPPLGDRLRARPFLSRDGRRLFFISKQEYETFSNPEGVPELWGVAITDGSGTPTGDWTARCLTPMLAANEAVVLASCDRTGSQVVYSQSVDGGLSADLRFVRVDYPGNARTADPGRTAHHPFQLQGELCSASEVSGETIVSIGGYLRQFKNAASPTLRNVMLLLEASFAGGSVGRAPISVQRIDDGQRALIEGLITVPGTGLGPPTCHVRAVDGSVIQADVVDLAFQSP